MVEEEAIRLARLRWRRLVRAKSHTALRRGVIVRAPCVDCGSDESEMHHRDYLDPLDVEWVCRPCHRARHDADRPRRLGRTYPLPRPRTRRVAIPNLDRRRARARLGL